MSSALTFVGPTRNIVPFCCGLVVTLFLSAPGTAQNEKAAPNLLAKMSVGRIDDEIELEDVTLGIITDKALPKLLEAPSPDEVELFGKVPPPKGGTPIWIPISHAGSEGLSYSMTASISGVPEPSTMLLAMSATALIALQRRHR